MRYYTLYDEEASQGYSENNPKPQMTIIDWVFWIIVGIAFILWLFSKIEEFIDNKKTKK